MHNRANATRLSKPHNIAGLGEGKATFFRGDNRFALLESQRNPMHLVVWDIARNETLTLGAPYAQISRHTKFIWPVDAVSEAH